MASRSPKRAQLLVGVAALGALARGASAQDAAPGAAELDLWIDRSLIAGAFATTPLDAYTDAKAAATLAEVRTQLDRFTRLSFRMPLADALAAPRHLRLQCFSSGSSPGGHATMVVDAGAGAEQLCDWFELSNSWDPPAPATCGPCTGVMTASGLFMGTHGADALIGERDHVPALADAPEMANPPAPLVLRCSGDIVASMLGPSPSIPRGGAELVAALLPIPPAPAITLETLADPAGAGGWISSFTVRGIGPSALRPISPHLAAAIRPGQQLTMALGVDPAWLGKLLSSCLDAAVPDAVLKELGAHATGDALLQASWSLSPLPAAALVLPLDDQAPLLAALTASDAQGAQALADKTPVWQVTLGTSALIAVAHGELVIATDADTLAAAFAAAQAGPPPWTPAQAMVLDADLPAIGARLLPLAMLGMGSGSAPMADPVAPLRWLLFRMSQDADEHTLQMEAQNNHGIAAALKALCDGGVEHLKPLISVFASATPNTQPLQAIILTPDGYRIMGPWNADGDRVVKTLAEAQQAQRGLRLRFGVNIDALRIVSPLATPTIGTAWIPPLPVLLSHLRPYHCAIERGPDFLSIHDSGLPVIGATSFALVFGGYMTASEMREAKAMRARQEAEAAKRRAEAQQPRPPAVKPAPPSPADPGQGF